MTGLHSRTSTCHSLSPRERARVRVKLFSGRRSKQHPRRGSSARHGSSQGLHPHPNPLPKGEGEFKLFCTCCATIQRPDRETLRFCLVLDSPFLQSRPVI